MQRVESPPRELLFRRRIHLGRAAGRCWAAREIVLTLAHRDFIARYKQATLGVFWAFFTPLSLMVVFGLVFTRVADIDTRGAPYVLFAYLGLLPWTFLSSSVSQGGLSLVLNAQLLNRTFFPREVFPLSSVAVAAVDMTIAATALVGLFAITGFAPAATSLWVPLLLLMQLIIAVALAVATSVIVVYLRDLRHAIPVLLQLGLFATPVAYGLDAVSGSWRLVYCAVNPIAAVIDGYRRTVLWGEPPAWDAVGVGAASALVMLVGGYYLFKRLEGGLADVA